MPISAAFYRKLESLDPIFRDIFLSLFEEVERSREQSVTKDEFKELKEIVRELAEAQKRTEARVEELAEAQKRTEARVEELAEAQKRTEQELQLLTAEHRKTRKQVGGLAMTVGYRLEDEAFKALPSLLKRDHGIEIEGRLKRQFVADNKARMIEVNIFGKALRDGRQIVILGESKSQLSKKLVDEFITKKLSQFSDVFKDVFPVMVTYMTTEPGVEEHARKKGVALYYSYDF